MPAARCGEPDAVDALGVQLLSFGEEVRVLRHFDESPLKSFGRSAGTPGGATKGRDSM
jgi:hypothetical protein